MEMIFTVLLATNCILRWLWQDVNIYMDFNDVFVVRKQGWFIFGSLLAPILFIYTSANYCIGVNQNQLIMCYPMVEGKETLKCGRKFYSFVLTLAKTLADKYSEHFVQNLLTSTFGYVREIVMAYVHITVLEGFWV